MKRLPPRLPLLIGLMWLLGCSNETPPDFTTDPGTGETTVRVDTTVDQLPSVDFLWVAYAFDNAEMGRLPEPGEYGHWATIEILLP